MHEPGTGTPDWNDASAYGYLLKADRSSFAWEWLRRLPEYRAAASSSSASPTPFGLCRFEDPMLGAAHGKPIWHADHDRSVLLVRAVSSGKGDTFDILSLQHWATVHVDDHGEHWRIGQGLRSIRLDIIAGSLRAGSVCLDYQISGLSEATLPVLTLRRFLALACRRHWSAKLFPLETRARRWINMLRVHDALTDGASQRDIAVRLFGDTIIASRWRSTSPSYRLRIQRLAAGARAMAAGGWRTLLAPAVKL